MTDEIIANPLDKIASGDVSVDWRVRSLVKGYLNILESRESMKRAEELIRAQLAAFGFDLDALLNKIR
jgi:hypothetical protein